MRSKDPNLIAAVVLGTQAGGVQLPTKQFDGVLDAVVLDTHATNPSLCPVEGTCRVTIPSLEATVPWGPVAYPGASVPPDGAACQVEFVTPVANGSVDASVRVMCFPGFPTIPTIPAWLPSLIPTVQTSAYSAMVGDMVLAQGTFSVASPTFSTPGESFGVTNAGTGTATITVSGGGYFFGPGIPSMSTSISLAANGSTVTLMSMGIFWAVVAGAIDTGWLPMTMLNNWVNFTSITGNAADWGPGLYRKIGNVVRLSGLVANQNAAGSAQALWTPPSGFVPPASKMFFQPFIASGASNPGRFEYRSTTGNFAPNTGASAAVSYLSLDGVSWTTD